MTQEDKATHLVVIFPIESMAPHGTGSKKFFGDGRNTDGLNRRVREASIFICKLRPELFFTIEEGVYMTNEEKQKSFVNGLIRTSVFRCIFLTRRT